MQLIEAYTTFMNDADGKPSTECMTSAFINARFIVSVSDIGGGWAELKTWSWISYYVPRPAREVAAQLEGQLLVGRLEERA